MAGADSFDAREPGRRVAVIGSGAAGLAAAWYLARRHRVTVLGAAAKIGGHVHTVLLPDGPDAGTPIDMGFIVYNERNYPRFSRLLGELGVASQPSEMSFGYACEETGLHHPLQVIDGWDVPGTHYQRTCEAWLHNMRRNRAAVEAALARAYGEREVRRRWHMWRVLYLACAELFAYGGGNEWIVAHRLLAHPASAR